MKENERNIEYMHKKDGSSHGYHPHHIFKKKIANIAHRTALKATFPPIPESASYSLEYVDFLIQSCYAQQLVYLAPGI